MKKDKLKVVCITIVIITLFIYSFYIHRDQPHWFDARYVRVTK